MHRIVTVTISDPKHRPAMGRGDGRLTMEVNADTKELTIIGEVEVTDLDFLLSVANEVIRQNERLTFWD